MATHRAQPTSAEEIEENRKAFLKMDYLSQVALQFFINEMLDLTLEPVSPLPATPKRKKKEKKQQQKTKATSPAAGPSNNSAQPSYTETCPGQSWTNTKEA